MLELAETSPFSTPLPSNPGLIVTARTGLGLATIQPLAGQQATVYQRLADAFGLTLTSCSKRHTGIGITAIGIGPSRYLLTSDTAGNQLAKQLRDLLGDIAAIEDQSDGYAILRLAGPRCPAILARGINIDLHPAAFPTGAAAVTSIAHMGIMLWRLDDDASGPSFELAVFRSMAGTLLHWLGLSIIGAGPSSV